MTFRDEEKKDLTNDDSTYSKKIGNAVRETETYHELKFKSSSKLAEFNEINFDTLTNLIFQLEIKYKNTDGKRYIRVITQNLAVSDNKEMINKQAKMNIISNLQARKSAKLAGQGNLMEAQAQIHVARNFLNLNSNNNANNMQVFNQFNRNMNSFNNNMMMMNNMNMMQSAQMNPFGNNNMMNNNNLFGNNNMMNNMNNNNNLFGNNNMMNNMNNNNNLFGNNMMNNNLNENNDYLSAQIFQIAHQSENQSNMNYLRSEQNSLFGNKK